MQVVILSLHLDQLSHLFFSDFIIIFLNNTLELVTNRIKIDHLITVLKIIKRCLLLKRKAMTNLDSVLKSRDITLQTKVCIVKAVVFPVVMYGCESWPINHAEC